THTKINGNINITTRLGISINAHIELPANKIIEISPTKNTTTEIKYLFIKILQNPYFNDYYNIYYLFMQQLFSSFPTKNVFRLTPHIRHKPSYTSQIPHQKRHSLLALIAYGIKGLVIVRAFWRAMWV
ncbi:MAG: hypothetical protein LBH43_14895, partial [Treponema sp.]|nr:hypothetical protein [Treponema sp.]